MPEFDAPKFDLAVAQPEDEISQIGVDLLVSSRRLLMLSSMLAQKEPRIAGFGAMEIRLDRESVEIARTTKTALEIESQAFSLIAAVSPSPAEDSQSAK